MVAQRWWESAKQNVRASMLNDRNEHRHERIFLHINYYKNKFNIPSFSHTNGITILLRYKWILQFIVLNRASSSAWEILVDIAIDMIKWMINNSCVCQLSVEWFFECSLIFILCYQCFITETIKWFHAYLNMTTCSALLIIAYIKSTL